jgi:hypothetical protein
VVATAVALRHDLASCRVRGVGVEVHIQRWLHDLAVDAEQALEVIVQARVGALLAANATIVVLEPARGALLACREAADVRVGAGAAVGSAAVRGTVPDRWNDESMIVFD